MEFKIGQKVLIKEEAAKYSAILKELFEKKSIVSGTLISIIDDDVICGVCVIKHKPVYRINIDNVGIVRLTKCEIRPHLKKLTNKILKL